MYKERKSYLVDLMIENFKQSKLNFRMRQFHLLKYAGYIINSYNYMILPPCFEYTICFSKSLYLLFEFVEHISHSALFRQPNIMDYNLK